LPQVLPSPLRTAFARAMAVPPRVAVCMLAIATAITHDKQASSANRAQESLKFVDKSHHSAVKATRDPMLISDCTSLPSCPVVSPDGKHFLTTESGRPLELWSMRLGRVVRQGPLADFAAFSPDSRSVVAIRKEAMFSDIANERTYGTVWDIATMKELHTLKLSDDSWRHEVESVRFSPSGKHILTVMESSTVLVWDLATGEVQHKLSGADFQYWFKSAEFSPNGQQVVTASEYEPSPDVWDLTTGESRGLQVPEFQSDGWDPYGMNSAKFSADGTRVVGLSEEGTTAFVWDVATGEVQHVLQSVHAHTARVRSAELSPNGTQVVTASDDQTAKVWNLATGDVRTLAGRTDVVRSAMFSQYGDQVFTASDDNTLKVWRNPYWDVE